MYGYKNLLPGFIIILLMLSGLSKAAEQPLLIASGEFKPFTSSEYQGGGFLHELVMQAFSDTGLSAQALFLPWGRGYSGVQKHHFAATFPYVWSQQREATFVYSKPLLTVSGALYVNAELVSKYRSPKDLEGLLMCLPKHFSSEFLKPFVGSFNLHLVRAADDLGCLEMLALGRVDGTPVDILRAQELMKENESVADAVAMLPWTVSQKTYHLVIDKAYPDAKNIVLQFDQAYRKIKQSPVWNRVLLKHAIDSRWTGQADTRKLPLSEFIVPE